MTTNVARANPPDGADERRASTLLYELERDERERERERQGDHARKWQRWDAETRDLTDRCGYCGKVAANGAGSRELARDWCADDARGNIEVGRCIVCVQLYRSHALGDIALNADTLTLGKGLARAGLDKYNPPKELWTRRLVGLSWVSFAFKARIAGDDDPGDPEVAFSHLQGLRPEGIDWSPAMPEPAMPRRLPVATMPNG